MIMEKENNLDELFNDIERIRKVKGFLNRVEKELGYEFNPDDEDSRVKFQKYVFLAKQFGFNPRYSFKKYVNGPYSSQLAKDYHSNEFTQVRPTTPNQNLERFIDLVKGKNLEWLCVASTLVSVYNQNKDRMHLGELETFTVGKTSELRNEVPRDYVKQVFNTLREQDVISTDIF